MTSETEKAYVAGLMDGEGTVHIVLQRNKSRNRPEYLFAETYISNTDVSLLRWVQAKFGGKVRLSRANKGRNWKPLYRLHFHGKAAGELLKEISPYIVAKKGRIEMVLDLLHCTEKYLHPLPTQEREHRMGLYWKCRGLNARGIRDAERLSEGAPERVVRQSDLAGNEPQEMGPKSPVRQSC